MSTITMRIVEGDARDVRVSAERMVAIDAYKKTLDTLYAEERLLRAKEYEDTMMRLDAARIANGFHIGSICVSRIDKIAQNDETRAEREDDSQAKADATWAFLGAADGNIILQIQEVVARKMAAREDFATLWRRL